MMSDDPKSPKPDAVISSATEIKIDLSSEAATSESGASLFAFLTGMLQAIARNIVENDESQGQAYAELEMSLTAQMFMWSCARFARHDKPFNDAVLGIMRQSLQECPQFEQWHAELGADGATKQ
jgi:hypothetical protein